MQDGRQRAAGAEPCLDARAQKIQIKCCIRSALVRGNAAFRATLRAPRPSIGTREITLIAQPKTGLGTGIVKALAQQLGAKIETLAGPEGTTVSVTHATFLAKMPGVV